MKGIITFCYSIKLKKNMFRQVMLADDRSKIILEKFFFYTI